MAGCLVVEMAISNRNWVNLTLATVVVAPTLTWTLNVFHAICANIGIEQQKEKLWLSPYVEKLALTQKHNQGGLCLFTTFTSTRYALIAKALACRLKWHQIWWRRGRSVGSDCPACSACARTTTFTPFFWVALGRKRSEQNNHNGIIML